MVHIEFTTPSTLPQPNGYSHVAAIGPGSRLVWTSGQVPIAADGVPAPAGDWESQTRQTMRNVGAALAAAGAAWDDVFKLTFYVIDTSALATVRAVRDEFINIERPPTSSLVQVAGLFRSVTAAGVCPSVAAVVAFPMSLCQSYTVICTAPANLHPPIEDLGVR